MSQRAKNVNKEQKEILIQYMEKNPKLISGKFSKDFTYKSAQHLWNKIATELNSVPNGGKKDWHQWRKVWQDMRTKTKSKKAKLVKERNETGGGIPAVDTLSHEENAVLDLMSPILWTGIGQVTESTVEGFDQIESVRKTDSELVPEEITFEDTCNTQTSENPTCIYTNSETESPRLSTETTPRGRKKEQRLSETIKAAKTIEKIAQKKLELKEKYYEAKIKLIERDVQAKEEIAQYLKFICSKLE